MEKNNTNNPNKTNKKQDDRSKTSDNKGKRK